MKHRASSLILVVVIMSAIIVVVFGANRLALVQYNQANRDEDNIAALYAAKAGIEDGLLRFRYNRDVETTLGSVDRYNLTTGTSKGEVVEGSEETTFIPTDQYYDLSIKFRDKQIGDFIQGSANNETLTKDTTLELTGFPNDPQSYYLRHWFEFTNCSGATANQMVQIQQTRATADINNPASYDQVTVRKPATQPFVADSQGTGNLPILTSPSSNPVLTNTIRIRSYGCDVNYSLATSRSSTGTGQSTDAGPNFDSNDTVITSTGYFGLTKRTLVATVDRISGQLISIYDFNIYSGQGDIKP